MGALFAVEGLFMRLLHQHAVFFQPLRNGADMRRHLLYRSRRTRDACRLRFDAAVQLPYGADNVLDGSGRFSYA